MNTSTSYTKNDRVKNRNILGGTLNETSIGEEIKSCSPKRNVTMNIDWENQGVNCKRGDCNLWRNRDNYMCFETSGRLLICTPICLR